MTSKQSISSRSTVIYNEFQGIDRSAQNTGAGIVSDIVNFKVTSCGALKKRSGFSPKSTLVSKPRAYLRLDESSAMMLVGDQFGILNTEDLSFSAVDRVATSEGDASFFCYDGDIYLADGGSIYLCNRDGIIAADGYAPLYGKDWDPITAGSVHEKANLLSDHLRISYNVGESFNGIFLFNVYVHSIDGVFVNGTQVSKYSFTLDDGHLSATCGITLEEGDSVEFFLTANVSSFTNEVLKSCTRAVIFGKSGEGRGADVSSVAFYNGVNKGTVLCTRKIPTPDFLHASSIYPNASKLYVTDDDILTIGSGVEPVMSVCRRGSRLLAFTRGDAYAITESDTASHAFHLSSAGGCSAFGSALSMQDSPVSLSSGSILKWSPISYDQDGYRAESISDPILGLTSNSFYRDSVSYLFKKEGEMWFTDPGSDDHRVFIYSIPLKLWYTYSGIDADMFFETDDTIGFFKDNIIYTFDDSSYRDVTGGGSIYVCASFTLDTVHFGSYNRRKRLQRIVSSISPFAGIDVEISDALGDKTSLFLTDHSEEVIGRVELRVRCKRSRYYSLSLKSSYTGAEEIYGLTLTAVS